MGTRGAWARDFLTQLGNTTPSNTVVNLVACWTAQENTDARYNPLATTLDYGSNTKFNSVGVRNYETRQQGIEASAITLRGKFTGYDKILRGLATNDANLAADGMLTPLNPWGTNFGVVIATWRVRDVTGEVLRSEPTGETHGKDTPRPYTPDSGGYGSGGYAPTYNSPEYTSSGSIGNEITADSVKQWFKIGAGVIVGIIGGTLLIITVIKSDTVQATANLVKPI